jgi:HD-like signal output (HDOD) protein
MNPKIEQLFDQAIRLPQIPHVMQEVLKSLRDEDVSISALAALVSSDQVIAAKVLRLANSSYYGARRNVASVNDAVKLIGLNAFRNLVIASSLVSAFPKIEGFDLAGFWRNSMLVANLSHLVGRGLDVDREMLFTAGLMHGIGELLIYLGSPETASLAVSVFKNSALGEQRGLERELLQMDHFEVGMELARRWNFPESIQTVVGCYDAPPSDNLPAHVVHVAVLISRGIQLGSTIDDMLASVPPDMAKSLLLDRSWFEEAGEVFDQLLQEAALLV